MARKYADPPIVEAVCELRLTRDTDWDLTVPGLVYEKVRGDYPNREQRIAHELALNQRPERVEEHARTSERMLFLDEDRKSFIQVGAHLLAVNCLRPYPTWGAFRSRIEKAFAALAETVRVRGLQRIGVRYINRIEIPGEAADLAAYFQFRPFLGPELPRNLASFMVGCLISFSDGRDSCRIQLTNGVAEKPGHVAYVLDIDYFLAQPLAVAPDETLEWIDTAHDAIEKLFEGCITDRLRALFHELRQ